MIGETLGSESESALFAMYAHAYLIFDPRYMGTLHIKSTVHTITYKKQINKREYIYDYKYNKINKEVFNGGTK